MEEKSDDALANLAKAGREDCMDELLDRYRNYVKSRARSFFLAGSEPEDLVQEGMIGLYKAIRDYSPEKNASFRNFARLCINRQIITAIKTANRDKHKPLNNYLSLSHSGEGEEDGFAVDLVDTAAGSNPEEAMLSKELRETLYTQVKSALTALESGILNDYLSGMSYGEIAAKRETNAKSVDNALQRIRKKLQKVVDR